MVCVCDEQRNRHRQRPERRLNSARKPPPFPSVQRLTGDGDVDDDAGATPACFARLLGPDIMLREMRAMRSISKVLLYRVICVKHSTKRTCVRRAQHGRTL